MANTLTISWTAPSIGSTPVSYEYAYCLSTDNIDLASINATNSTTATIYPASNGVTYKYRVRSVGTNNLRSRWSQIYTMFCAPPPSAPTTTPVPTTLPPTNTPIPTTMAPTNTPVPTASLSPINFNVTPSCVGYAPTGVTITVSDPTGGTGSGYYVVMTSPYGLDATHYSLPHSYTGLANYVGNTYAFSVFDSAGNGSNYALVQDYGCAAAPNNTASLRLVISSIKPTLAEYNSASSYSVDLGSPSATVCNAQTFTNSSFQTLGTGNNYWLCYDDGSSKQARQMFHPSNAGYFLQAGGCQTITY